jgi:hypothetical protein
MVNWVKRVTFVPNNSSIMFFAFTLILALMAMVSAMIYSIFTNKGLKQRTLQQLKGEPMTAPVELTNRPAKVITISFFVACISLFGVMCNSCGSAPEKVSNGLKNFTKEDVARFAVSTVMNRPSKSMQVITEGDLCFVSYTRETDGKQFQYKTKLVGNAVVWANIDGRWRDAPEDERLRFTEQGDTLVLEQVFSDGTGDVKKFAKGQ